MKIENQSPLKWPDGWERARIQDRKSRAGWKKSMLAYREAVGKELSRMGATEVLVSFNPSPSDRLDCGVAVYFSKSQTTNYDWQDALGLLTPAPTLEQIDQAFRRLARQCHPDGPSPDIPLFHALAKHRENAIAWIRGTQQFEHEYVIACDRFTETRLNLAAIKLALAALRQLERVGVSSVLERAFKGFRTALPEHASTEVKA